MYEEKRIISTPISNNRLNFEERTNRTIIVPSLIEGTPGDVVIGTETVIEAEIGGKIIAGKGLKNFVFLKNAQVPTWICDNHNHAFAFWHEAYWKGFIKKGALLVHIDQHTDLATPTEMPRQSTKYKVQNNGNSKNKNPPLCPLSSVFCTLEEVEDYTNSVLTIADFIVPALATGLISETLMVTGEDRNGAGLFTWKNEELIKKSIPVIARTTLGVRGDPGIPETESWIASLNSQGRTLPSLILDIDLDYFSQGFDDAKTLEITKYWIEKADIITIATSPLFIEQANALRILKKIENSLIMVS